MKKNLKPIYELLDKFPTSGRAVSDIGHDRGGYEVTLTLPELNARVTVSDDGWGGECELDYQTGLRGKGKDIHPRDIDKKVKALLVKKQVSQIMRDAGGWGDLIKDEDLTDPKLTTCLPFLAEEWLNRKGSERFIKRNQKKGLVYSDPKGTVKGVSWKSPLEAYVAHYGVEKTQKMLDDAAAEDIPAGSILLNTNLEALGLKKPVIK